ncbi:MAG: hypothetical protein ACYDG2_00285 [Ruminiclostridium sp.]
MNQQVEQAVLPRLLTSLQQITLSCKLAAITASLLALVSSEQEACIKGGAYGR